MSDGEIKKKKFNIKNAEFYAESSIKGVLMGAVSFLFSHPVDVIKIKMQSESSLRLGIIDEIKQIYKVNGLRGYYTGWFPSLIRFSTKNLYRWPLMMYLPAFYNQFTSPVNSKLLTAFTLGNFEALIYTPVERIKTFLITRSVSSHSIIYFYNNSKFRDYFRGLIPTIYKQNLSWFSFLYFDYILKKVVYNHKLNKKCDDPTSLNFLEMLVISFLVAVCNTIVILPFDYVKTQAQKENYIKVNGTLRFLRLECKFYGISIVYSGWKAKLLHYIIQSSFNVNLLYYLERKTYDI